MSIGMKNVYFFLISIELTRDLVKSAKTETVECTFENNDAKAIFNAGNIPCEETDLILQDDDDRLLDVVAVELTTNCISKHLWKIISPNTFKRFAKLTELLIQGLILLPDDTRVLGKLQSELFHVLTITNFEYSDCFTEGTRGKSVQWVLPPNVTQITIADCDIAQFDWKKLVKLIHLKITDTKNRIKKIPELGLPSLHELDILWATEIDFTIPELGYFCNMTKFIFNDDKMRREDHCKCELLQEWQNYLETENITLEIYVYDELFKNKACNAGECPTFNDTLNEANSSRFACLSVNPPTPEPPPPTVIKKEFDSRSTLFWESIMVGFLIIAIIYTMIMFISEKIRLMKATDYIDEEEEEEEEEEGED